MVELAPTDLAAGQGPAHLGMGSISAVRRRRCEASHPAPLAVS